MLSNLAFVILVVSLVSNLADFPQFPGVMGGQSATHIPLPIIAALVILLTVTSRPNPQPR